MLHKCIRFIQWDLVLSVQQKEKKKVNISKMNVTA